MSMYTESAYKVRQGDESPDEYFSSSSDEDDRDVLDLEKQSEEIRRNIFHSFDATYDTQILASQSNSSRSQSRDNVVNFDSVQSEIYTGEVGKAAIRHSLPPSESISFDKKVKPSAVLQIPLPRLSEKEHREMPERIEWNSDGVSLKRSNSRKSEA